MNAVDLEGNPTSERSPKTARVYDDAPFPGFTPQAPIHPSTRHSSSSELHPPPHTDSDSVSEQQATTPTTHDACMLCLSSILALTLDHREHRASELDTDRAPEAPEQLPPHPHHPRHTQMPRSYASRVARPTQAEPLSGSHISAHQLTGLARGPIRCGHTLDRHKLPRSAVADERLRTEASSHMVTVTMGDHAVR